MSKTAKVIIGGLMLFIAGTLVANNSCASKGGTDSWLSARFIVAVILGGAGWAILES